MFNIDINTQIIEKIQINKKLKEREKNYNMVSVWKERIRLNAVFINDYKNRFVAGIKVYNSYMYCS